MGQPRNNKSLPVLKSSGFSSAIAQIVDEMRSLYLADDIPWVIGYSGGKDSSAVVQLTWIALEGIKASLRKKPVYVITTDTLVENPVVAVWVEQSLSRISETAKKAELPIQTHLLKPEIKDAFWVNLIGKGYPAPRQKFRWCTERLKINPTTNFIRNTISQHGEVLLLLGARTNESAARAASLKRRKRNSTEERLSPHTNLVNCTVYTPIEDWSSDNVWTFLLQVKNPWGHSNKNLMSMYRGATADNECPVVIDTSTPSCGSSRFGCWVCTLVEQDKSMTAMIQNDEEKEWMLPLLELRNELDFRTEKDRKRDRSRREFKRLAGHLSHYTDRDGEVQLVPGPYTQSAREHWLRKLLSIQCILQNNKSAPKYVRKIQLISLDELQEIRRIWVKEKHEIEDLLPGIYQEELNVPYPGIKIEEDLVFDREGLNILREVCTGNIQRYELVRNLLDIERGFRTMGSRRGLFEKLEKTIRQGFYTSKEDAEQWMKERAKIKDKIFVSEDGRIVNYDGITSHQQRMNSSISEPALLDS